MVELYNNARKGWTAVGGELIQLPADEQASMMKTFSTAVADVAKANPKVSEAFKIVSERAQRTR
jgi:hypothetical protein